MAVLFTNVVFTLLILFSFKDWDRQSPTDVVTEMCGFVTILSGTFLLHKTKDMGDGTFFRALRLCFQNFSFYNLVIIHPHSSVT